MAKRHAIFPLFLAIAFSGLLLLCGCEMESLSTADALPPPSFDPPRVMAAAPQAPLAAAPVRPIPTPRTAQPAAPRVATAGIPADWVPPVAPRPWREIIVHHSATTTGGAAAFDKEHKAKGWDGLGYDFVIGNGTDTGDGQIEVGWRWTQQKIGAHDKTPDNYYNEYGIGICLVGNFMVERPTPRQLQSLTRLSSYLMKTYHIPPDHMLGHGNTKPTECPGKYLDVAMVRREAGLLAGYRPVASLSSSNELLTNLPR
jgi:N-acetylmuramoyl-L-alanine amidase